MRILVTGAGGFIGGHLVACLQKRAGVDIRAVDIKPVSEWFQLFDTVENIQADLRDRSACERVCQNVDDVYNLACDMGGMGFIEQYKAACMVSVLINTHMLLAAKDAGVKRYLFSSSACVYNAQKQDRPDILPLREADAYPAMPEDGYGWEKLFSERMCRHFMEDYGVDVRIVRIHNAYGPHGTWDGGREKAPAALCRKVIEALHTGTGEIEIWGDGTRCRSFMYIDDAIEGMERIMNSSVTEPMNLGSAESVTINQLVDSIEQIAGTTLARRYNRNAPLGVHGRNSDNTRIQELFAWEPSVPLIDGLRTTYAWIEQEYQHRISKST